MGRLTRIFHLRLVAAALSLATLLGARDAHAQTLSELEKLASKAVNDMRISMSLAKREGGCENLTSAYRAHDVASAALERARAAGATGRHLSWPTEDQIKDGKAWIVLSNETWKCAGISMPAAEPKTVSASVSSAGAPSAPAPQWRGVYSHIDWMWGNGGAPRDTDCKNSAVMDANGGYVRRGDASAHDVVVNGIRAARRGDYTAALNWLASGQCHNGSAADEIRAAGRAAVDYAVNSYGSKVDGGNGGGSSGPAPQSQIVVWQNTSGMTLYVYEAVSQSGVAVNCSALVYKRALANGAEYRSAALAAGTALWVRLQENQTDVCDSRYNKFEAHAAGPH